MSLRFSCKATKGEKVTERGSWVSGSTFLKVGVFLCSKQKHPWGFCYLGPIECVTWCAKQSTNLGNQPCGLYLLLPVFPARMKFCWMLLNKLSFSFHTSHTHRPPATCTFWCIAHKTGPPGGSVKLKAGRGGAGRAGPGRAEPWEAGVYRARHSRTPLKAPRSANRAHQDESFLKFPEAEGYLLGTTHAFHRWRREESTQRK